VAQYGERAVRNAAARELSAWLTEDTFQTLLDVLRQEPLTGAIETLGRFQRPETVPPDSEEWPQELKRTASKMLLFGHTHLPFVRAFSDGSVANPGSSRKRANRRHATRLGRTANLHSTPFLITSAKRYASAPDWA
jgi:hypothetical protein